MQDVELIDLFKNNKCKTCGADTVDYLQRYSKFNKCYYNLSADKLESYKNGVNTEIKRIVKRKQDKFLDNKKTDVNNHENISDIE